MAAEIVGWAESLANAMREQLQSADLASLLAEHEEAVRLEDAEKAAQSAAAGVVGQQLPEAEEGAAAGRPGTICTERKRLERRDVLTRFQTARS